MLPHVTLQDHGHFGQAEDSAHRMQLIEYDQNRATNGSKKGSQLPQYGIHIFYQTAPPDKSWNVLP